MIKKFQSRNNKNGQIKKLQPVTIVCIMIIIALLIYIIVSNNVRISEENENNNKKATAVSIDGNNYILETDHSTELAQQYLNGQNNIKGSAITAATYAAVTGADNSGISANQTLSTTTSNTITLGIGDSITLPAGYYAQPTIIQNGVINRGSFSFNPSTSTSTTGGAGYYSSVTANSANAYTAGYNAGKSVSETYSSQTVSTGSFGVNHPLSTTKTLTFSSFTTIKGITSISCSLGALPVSINGISIRRKYNNYSY